LRSTHPKLAIARKGRPSSGRRGTSPVHLSWWGGARSFRPAAAVDLAHKIIPRAPSTSFAGAAALDPPAHRLPRTTRLWRGGLLGPRATLVVSRNDGVSSSPCSQDSFCKIRNTHRARNDGMGGRSHRFCRCPWKCWRSGARRDEVDLPMHHAHTVAGGKKTAVPHVVQQDVEAPTNRHRLPHDLVGILAVIGAL
jgi:hypothetical protein